MISISRIIAGKRSREWLIGFFVVAAALLTLLDGCGNGAGTPVETEEKVYENSPEGAVERYFDAWEEGDWLEFRASVAPGKGASDKAGEELAKKQFEQVRVEFDGIEMDSEADPRDADKAEVTITGGTVTTTAEILGELESATEQIEGMVLKTVKVDGEWYVDAPLVQ